MNNNNSDFQYYLNSLIYIIILKSIAVLSLLLFLLPGNTMKYLSYTLITYQITLTIIICFVLYKIVNFNKHLKKLREEQNKSPAVLDNCPMYFTRTIDNDTNDIVCKNTFTTSDNRYTYEIQLPTGMDTNDDKLNITKLQDDNKTQEKLCNSYDDSTIGSLPWVEYKSKCEKL